MHFPEVAYLRWAKTHPPARINMARSGVEACPPSALGLTSRDLVVTLPVRDGYLPLRKAIARRYRVDADEVFTVSGGTSFANWFACAAALDGSPRGAERADQPRVDDSGPAGQQWRRARRADDARRAEAARRHPPPRPRDARSQPRTPAAVLRSRATARGARAGRRQRRLSTSAARRR